MLSSSSPLLLLLFLLLLPRSLGCQTTSFTECQNVPFVPGHNLAGEGFDVVLMKTSGANVVDVKNFMVGGVKGNCTVCHNHLMNQTQKLPVSVLDWRIQVHCRHRLNSKLHESSQSVIKEKSDSLGTSWKVGLEIPGLGGFASGGSLSKESKFADSRSKKDKYSFITHNFNCEYYTFRTHSRPPLSEDFESSLKNLPSTYDHRSTSAFKQFISVYGTHYIRRVQLGGRVDSITAIRTCETSMSKMSARVVSMCLSAEVKVAVGITFVTETKFCKKMSELLKSGKTFSEAFTDRTTDIHGGDGDVGDFMFNPGSVAEYKKWLSSLKRLPGVVSYQISPLHLLVYDNPILRQNLRAAISDYIRKNAKPLGCTAGCKIGSQNQNCACHCQGHQMVNSDCCPGEPGIARMNVTVIRAEGLWGDRSSKTDGYVKVFYGNQGGVTPVIWNNDFPSWNYLIRFETVNLWHKQHILFEVWDRNNHWDDNLLGKVDVIPTSGRNINQMFRLKHGSLFVRLSAECAPSLQGSLCEQYAATPPYEDVMRYTKEDQEHHWDSGRSGHHDSTLL